MTISHSNRNKKGDSNLPDSKDGGEKELNVFANNGDINVEFVNS